MRKQKTLLQRAQARKLVTITTTRKFSLVLSDDVKLFLRDVFGYISETLLSRIGNQLNNSTAANRIMISLVREIYTRHFIELHAQREGRILITMSQATALWYVCNMDIQSAKKSNTGNISPDYSLLILQLHQKLTSMR